MIARDSDRPAPRRQQVSPGAGGTVAGRHDRTLPAGATAEIPQFNYLLRILVSLWSTISCQEAGNGGLWGRRGEQLVKFTSSIIRYGEKLLVPQIRGQLVKFTSSIIRNELINLCLAISCREVMRNRASRPHGATEEIPQLIHPLGGKGTGRRDRAARTSFMHLSMLPWGRSSSTAAVAAPRNA
jgi:hypothetical protein